MSDRAAAFIAEWVRDHHDRLSDEGIAACREALLKDAHELGMGLAELEAAVGDVDAYLERAMRDRTDEQLRRIGESGATDT